MYPAKLLLFGEHVLLLGATALAVPVPAFSGRWSADENDPQAEKSREALRRLLPVLEDKHRHILDVQRFQNDLEIGLFFQSNIPQGYGLGSSGALCAGLYDVYSWKKTDDLSFLKNILASLEGCFHGQSSGIDPLTSYCGQPLLISNRTEVDLVETAEWPREKPVVFLIDTQLPRQTGPLVQWFLQQSETAVFRNMLNERFFPAHEAMLESWVSADAESFWPALQVVSALQRQWFLPMVPEKMHRMWDEGLETNHFTLKICGAGGGGFVLGFAREKVLVQELFKEFPLVFPFET
ncbi:MAG: hypothetical protein IT270_04605 [Saprospiraceae bacterium]|nr:hypothetical protein [Saprospiraceae bacterium]